MVQQATDDLLNTETKPTFISSTWKQMNSNGAGRWNWKTWFETITSSFRQRYYVGSLLHSL